MRHNLDAVFRINRNDGQDAVVACEFIKDRLGAVEERFVRLKNLSDLAVVLSDTTFSEARSDLAGIRHIAQALNQSAGFHKNGQLSEIFANSTKIANEKLKEAEGIVSTMKELYP